MKKSILNLGKKLNKVAQKSVNGGVGYACYSHSDCPGDMGCCRSGSSLGLCMEGEDYRRICSSSI